MNKPNPTLIRQCMVEYANQLGRPHFEICVVNRVVKSFATGVDDVFKPAIQKMVDDKNKRNAVNRRRELLNEFCEDHSYMKLAVLSEISAATMKRMLTDQIDCSDDQWARILNAFELMT
ncbi:MAG: hypothetical protein RSA09_00270 [Acinetobacter sp.]